MKRPDWVDILEIIYHQSPPAWDSNNSDHPFTKDTSYDSEEVNEILDELKSRELVRAKPTVDGYDPDTGEVSSKAFEYDLTRKGFDVAHDRELSRRQNTLNRSLVFFTFVLVVPEILSLVELPQIASTVIALLLFGGMLYMIHEGDLFAEA